MKVVAIPFRLECDVFMDCFSVAVVCLHADFSGYLNNKSFLDSQYGSFYIAYAAAAFSVMF